MTLVLLCVHYCQIFAFSVSKLLFLLSQKGLNADFTSQKHILQFSRQANPLKAVRLELAGLGFSKIVLCILGITGLTCMVLYLVKELKATALETVKILSVRQCPCGTSVPGIQYFKFDCIECLN